VREHPHLGLPLSLRIVPPLCSERLVAVLAATDRAVYPQALDYFKFGSGNGRVERAAWYIHPDGTSQTEESGRDQYHNAGGWYSMGLLCQMAWNQGDDLFGYDNNRVLRAYEYNAEYNLGNNVS
jgi:hypothetical protein